MSEILVVGGAGYIGSHVIIELLNNNQKIVVLDDLSTGSQNAVLGGEFYQGCMSDTHLLDTIFNKHKINSVMLLAGSNDVNESINNPLKYYKNNVSNTLILLNKMIEHKVLKIIFSSTASIYSSQKNAVQLNEINQIPSNPYAKSKLMVEKILKDFEHAYGLKYVIFRYFNAAGADPKGRIGFHEPITHLIPQVLKAASGRNQNLRIFGDDYDTKDGSCVRDYIHVMDIANAHLLALNYLNKTNQSDLFNLGNGRGYSVKEVAKMVKKVTNKDFEVKIEPRRAGDQSSIIANVNQTYLKLGWLPQFHSLEDIILHSWQWELNSSWH